MTIELQNNDSPATEIDYNVPFDATPIWDHRIHTRIHGNCMLLLPEIDYKLIWR